jgi:hypothetical protein
MVGKSVESDYTAKHFSLVSGAVILNPFTIKADSSSSTGFVLEKESSTSAHAFIEGGFRYRWAWLDRLAPADKCKVESVETEKAKAELRVEEAQLYSASIGGTQTEIDAARLEVTAAQQKVAAQKGQDAASAEATDCTERRAWETAQQEPPYFSLPTMWRRRGAMVLMPSDWTTRMGFAFADSSNTGAAGIAGSSDFYGELTPGWNLVNWSMHTSTAEKTPIRASLNFEPSLTLNTDRQILDVHERYLIGFAAVFGVPLGDGVQAAEASGASNVTTAPKPAPIAELLVRLGAVNVETPKFLNSTSRDILVENEVAAFRSGWGTGFDMELNVPVTESLGYLVARGNINFGFNPNPWTLTLGYTIPISQFSKLVTGGGK